MWSLKYLGMCETVAVNIVNESNNNNNWQIWMASLNFDLKKKNKCTRTHINLPNMLNIKLKLLAFFLVTCIHYNANRLDCSRCGFFYFIFLSLWNHLPHFIIPLPVPLLLSSAMFFFHAQSQTNGMTIEKKDGKKQSQPKSFKIDQSNINSNFTIERQLWQTLFIDYLGRLIFPFWRKPIV